MSYHAQQDYMYLYTVHLLLLHIILKNPYFIYLIFHLAGKANTHDSSEDYKQLRPEFLRKRCTTFKINTDNLLQQQKIRNSMCHQMCHFCNTISNR